MDLTTRRDDLLRGLQTVTAVVPSHPSLPVLGNVLCEARKKEGLVLSGTDLDISLRTRVTAGVRADGAISLVGKRMLDIVRELPPKDVTLRVEAGKAHIECDRSRFEIFGIAREDYPALPEVSFAEGITVPAGELHLQVESTIFAASRDETRPILSGVLWEVREGEMRMVATDGHRLARQVRRGPYRKMKGREVIVPQRALVLMRRATEPGEEVQIGLGENHLGVRSGASEIFCRLIEGPYPNYEEVVPRGNDRVAEAATRDLVAAVRRMAVVASPTTHRVELHFSEGSLRLSVDSRDVGAASEEVDVLFEGEALAVAFNAQYLEEALKALRTERVKIAMKSPERAVMIEPVGEAEGEEYLCLIMPLRMVGEVE